MEREKIKQLIREKCNMDARWLAQSEDIRAAQVRKMERDCYNKTIEGCKRDGIDRLWAEKKFRERYSSECYRIISNMGDYLIGKLVVGEVNPEEITKLSNYELDPEATKAERDEITMRKNIKTDIKVSRMFVCPKCGKNETTLRVYQARCADEGDTTSIKCINCEFTWRKG